VGKIKQPVGVYRSLSGKALMRGFGLILFLAATPLAADEHQNYGGHIASVLFVGTVALTAAHLCPGVSMTRVMVEETAELTAAPPELLDAIRPRVQEQVIASVKQLGVAGFCDGAMALYGPHGTELPGALLQR
jgi:hypothetical protein